jgi:hypothetical protein
MEPNYSLDWNSEAAPNGCVTNIDTSRSDLVEQLADPEVGWLDGLVDLERNSLNRMETEGWTKLTGDCRDQLARHGSVTMPGFLTDAALADIADELCLLARHVPIRDHSASVYARSDLEAELDADDPRTKRARWIAGHVTRDMLPPYSMAQRLYVSGVFEAFITAVVGQERVFEYADPLAGLVATILPPGGCYPWHYDTNEYVVSIMIRPPDSGGTFEFHRNLRQAGDENLDGLGAVLNGHPTNPPSVLQGNAGDLQLFLGRYSLHQVTETAGATDRHVLVLSYAEGPGVIGPVDRTRSVYGRITEDHLLAEQARLASNDGLIL